MKKGLKPVHISLLTILVFVVALFLGMQSQWWETSGRRTPLDDERGGGHGGEEAEEHIQDNIYETKDDEHSGESDHATTEVTGNTTVETALALGITMDELEEVSEGKIDDTTALVKAIVQERGLKFGEVKDRLNDLLNN